MSRGINDLTSLSISWFFSCREKMRRIIFYALNRQNQSIAFFLLLPVFNFMMYWIIQVIFQWVYFEIKFSVVFDHLLEFFVIVNSNFSLLSIFWYFDKFCLICSQHSSTDNLVNWLVGIYTIKMKLSEKKNNDSTFCRNDESSSSEISMIFFCIL